MKSTLLAAAALSMMSANQLVPEYLGFGDLQPRASSYKRSGGNNKPQRDAVKNKARAKVAAKSRRAQRIQRKGK